MTQPYDQQFFESIDEGSHRSALKVAPLVLNAFSKQIHTVIDVGAGSGAWTKTFLDEGLRVTSVDGAYAREQYEGVRNAYPNHVFVESDLSHSILPERPPRFDLAVCLEVAEHLPGDRAAGFVKELCGLADAVLFSAAIPYQGGTEHINEQWMAYWAKLFREQHFQSCDFLRTEIWNDVDVEWWYKQNIILFLNRRGVRILSPRYRSFCNDQLPLSMVHPEAYLWTNHKDDKPPAKKAYGNDRYLYRQASQDSRDKNKAEESQLPLSSEDSWPEVPKSEYIKSLPDAYIASMNECLLRYQQITKGPDQPFTEKGRWQRQHLIYGRMQQCRNQFLPWLSYHVELSATVIAEFGCGTGCSTVPLAEACKFLHAFDTDAEALECARNRLELLQTSNVKLHCMPPDWLKSRAPGTPLPNTNSPNVVVCYAFLEHLTPEERINFLQMAWAMLEPGGYLVTYETPNRLHWWDWHSSKLPFQDTLPDVLAQAYLSRSNRPDIDVRTQSLDQLITCTEANDFEELYRFGRGVSYHEFDLAIGLSKLEVIADSYSQKAMIRGEWAQQDAEWERALTSKFEKYAPAVNPAFAYPSLDLILRKPATTGPRDVGNTLSPRTTHNSGPPAQNHS